MTKTRVKLITVFFFGCLVMLLNVGTGHAAPCTPGTNCYCDKVKGGSLNDPQLLMCEDFEAPTLYNNQGVGNGPPYYGPWYDDSSAVGDRGRNSYWQRVHGTGSGTMWQLGMPANPTLGRVCAFGPPNFESCTGIRVYDAAGDRWNGNSFQPVVQFIRNGEFGSYIPGETAPTGSAGGGSGVFDGTASLGALVNNTTPLGIYGGVSFPNSPIRTFGVTQAIAMASNMAVQNPVHTTNWKFSEWGVPGLSGGDGLFLFGLGGRLDSTFPFYGFTFFDVASSGCAQGNEACYAATCQANIATATILKGTMSCDGAGNLIWLASSSDYTRTVDWPLATWACARANFTNLGTTASRIEVWFTGPAGVEKKLIDFTANMTNHVASRGYINYVFNNYANTNSPLVGGGDVQGPTARYEDNIHIRAGASVPCSQIGFGGASVSNTTPPVPPTNLRVN